MNKYQVELGCKKCQSEFLIKNCDMDKLKEKIDKFYDKGCPECGEEADWNMILLDIKK